MAAPSRSLSLIAGALVPALLVLAAGWAAGADPVAGSTTSAGSATSAYRFTVTPQAVTVSYSHQLVQRGFRRPEMVAGQITSRIAVHGLFQAEGPGAVLKGRIELVSAKTDSGEDIQPEDAEDLRPQGFGQNSVEFQGQTKGQGWFNANLPGPRKPFKVLTSLTLKIVVDVAGSTRQVRLQPISKFLDQDQDFGGMVVQLGRPDDHRLTISGPSALEGAITNLQVFRADGGTLDQVFLTERSMGAETMKLTYLMREVLADDGAVSFQVAEGIQEEQFLYELKDISLDPSAAPLPVTLPAGSGPGRQKKASPQPVAAPAEAKPEL